MHTITLRSGDRLLDAGANAWRRAPCIHVYVLQTVRWLSTTHFINSESQTSGYILAESHADPDACRCGCSKYELEG
jgi:hypothetical protein